MQNFTLLTYKTWLAEKFVEQFSGRGWEISWGEEIGENGEYNHTHIVINFGKRFQTMKANFFDVEGVHPHIKMLPGKKALLAALEYIQKEGIRFDITEPSNLTLAEQFDGITKAEALNMCKRFSDVPGCLMLLGASARPTLGRAIPQIELYGWEYDIIKILESPPDRKIHWFWEPIGNVGKSTFARWMRLTYPEDIRVLTNPGGQRDFATIVENMIGSGWTGTMMILDLPRNAESHSIYEPIESIKNGFLNSVKYQGQEIIMDKNVHVVVFANWPPDKSKASIDRWAITNIKNCDSEEP